MNFCERNKLDLDKLANGHICRHFGPPFAAVFPWFGISCVVDSGTCDFRLDSSRLFYLDRQKLGSLLIQIEKLFADVHCMKCRIRYENKNLDVMGT